MSISIAAARAASAATCWSWASALRAAPFRSPAFEFGTRFDWILIACRAFQHLIEPAAQRAALAAARRHVAAGGHLVIDLFDPRLDFCLPDAPLPEQAREVWDPVANCRVRRTVLARDNDPFRQVVSERLRIEALAEDGSVLAAEETSWALRWTLRQEMAYLLELCGFELVEQLSDFHGGAPAYGKEQLWIARAV